MACGLSFTEAFFSGECELDTIEKSDRPTSVYQAALSLERSRAIEIGREVFGYDQATAEFWADSESMPFDIVEKVRETDTCGDLSSPVDVWIDPEGWYTLNIHE